MDRHAAINLLSARQLDTLSKVERKDILDSILYESWENSKDWHLIPQELIAEKESQRWHDPVNAAKYDVLVLLVLKDRLYPVTNAYLATQLNTKEIIGKPDIRFSCPCCGRKTLETIGEYDICPVCWWEDDGADNNERYDQISGPNRVALSTARYHFLNKGIYNPARTDLLKKCEPKEKYEIGRIFEIKNNHMTERGTNWSYCLYDKAIDRTTE